MPLYSDTEAQDALNQAVLDLFVAGAPAIIGGPLEIRWPKVTYKTKPDQTKYWARVSYQTVTSPQDTLGHCDEIGKRRFATILNLFVEVYGPMAVPDAPTKVEALARLARDRFRALRIGGIILLVPRVAEIPDDGKSYRRLFVVECHYDTAG